MQGVIGGGIPGAIGAIGGIVGIGMPDGIAIG